MIRKKEGRIEKHMKKKIEEEMKKTLREEYDRAYSNTLDTLEEWLHDEQESIITKKEEGSEEVILRLLKRVAEEREKIGK